MFYWFFAKICYSISKLFLNVPLSCTGAMLKLLSTFIIWKVKHSLYKPWGFQLVEAPGLKKLALKCVSILARVRLENLNLSQLVMKFREHYGGSNYTNFLHTGPKSIPLIGHINPVLSSPSHLQKIHFNVSLQQTGFQELSFSQSPPRNPAWNYALDLTGHMPRITP
jgi:hypothetical protein